MLDGIRDGRPGDQRRFIHKKIFGGISKIAGLASVVGIPGAGAVSTVTRSLAGRRTVPRTQTARITQFSEFEKRQGASLKFPGLRTTFPGTGFAGAGEGDCIIPGMRRDPGTGKCAFFLGTRKGPDGGFEGGEAVLGLYGAGVTPGSMVIDRAVCGKKMQLGDDGVCYNKSQISNRQRMWPAGRRPLLTGGDMRAISIAARAGTRMEKATSRLRKLGMMKKAPVARRPSAPTQHQRLLEAHVTK